MFNACPMAKAQTQQMVLTGNAVCLALVHLVDPTLRQFLPCLSSHFLMQAKHTRKKGGKSDDSSTNSSSSAEEGAD